MFNMQNTQAPQQQQNPRHFPANSSLNKNADGFVCSINMTHTDIVKSRYESRLEYFLQGKPKSSTLAGGAFGINSLGQPQGQQIFGQTQNPQQPPAFGGNQQFPQQQPQQQQQSLFGQQQQQQQSTQPGTNGIFSTLGGQAQQPLFQVQTQQLQQPQTGGLFQPQTQNNGGLFLPQQNQSLQGGLLTQLPQTQTQGGLFQPQQQQPQGLLFNQSQQKPLFNTNPPQFNTNPAQQFSTMGTPQYNNAQQPQVYQNQPVYYPQTAQYQQQESVAQVQLNLNIDYHDIDDLEGLHLREIENNFKSGLPIFSESFRSPVCDINLPGKQNIKINVNRPTPSRLLQKNPNQYPSLSSKTGQSTQLIISSRQQSSQNSNFSRPSMNNNQQRDLSANSQMLERSSMRSQIREDTTPSFTLSQVSQGRTITKLMTLSQIGFEKIQGATVKEFKEALVKHLYKNSKQAANYIIIDHCNNVSKIRKDSDLLSEIKFLGNKTIISLDTIDYTVNEEDEENDEEITQDQFEIIEMKNSRAPTIQNPQSMVAQPDIEELQLMTDKQLSKVENFSVETRFGKIQFLDPVDVKDLELDKIIIFAQDSVEFYPEEYGIQTPEKGSGINVKCMITFYRFGDASKKMKNLKLTDINKFKKNVTAWANNLDMELIGIEDSGEVKVILQSI